MVVSGLQPQRPPKWVRAAMLREPPDDRKGSLADRATGDSAPAQPLGKRSSRPPIRPATPARKHFAHLPKLHLKLYEPGQGVWNALHRDGKKDTDAARFRFCHHWARPKNSWP